MEVDEDPPDQDTIRNDIIAFILNNAESKLPFALSDVVNALEKEKRVIQESYPRAVEVLRDRYGILVKEVHDSKKGKKLICCAECPAKSCFEHDEAQRSQLALLFLILSYIFMIGHPVAEESLEKFLGSLRIYLDADHEFFGANLKKLIYETFVRQMYLKREKSVSEFDMETKFLYSWGARSFEEFDRRDVLQQTAKILGRPAEMFVSQFTEAYAAPKVETSSLQTSQK